MSDDMQRQEGQSSSNSDKESQTAIPYTPPPPPDESAQKRMRSPLVNGMLVAIVILLGGLMTYNYVGHQLTQLAGVSTEKTIVPSPSTLPSISPSISTSSAITSYPTP